MLDDISDRAAPGASRRRFAKSAILTLAGVLILASAGRGAPAGAPAPTGVRGDALRLVEDIERARMLLGCTLWLVHDLRNFALSGAGELAAVEAFDRANLDLYETLKPLDHAGTSLFAALDLGDDATVAADVSFLRDELGRVAPDVLAQYRAVAAEHESRRAALQAEFGRAGLELKVIKGRRWRDPVRERQRRAGVQFGWRTNIEPPDGFREHFWNDLQGLDIEYQLGKGRMLGVDFLVPKDPLLRWDRVEPAKDAYDFRALDHLLELAARYDFRVKLVLPTLTGRVPDWWLEERPESVVRDAEGKADFILRGHTFAEVFMGPLKNQDGSWFEARAVNLADEPTRRRFARFVAAVGRHVRRSPHRGRVLCVGADLFHPYGNWRWPADADESGFVRRHYALAAGLIRDAFGDLPVELEGVNGESHHIDADLSAVAWRSLGLTALVDVPSVSSETPFFEDLMRAGAHAAAAGRRRGVEAGPFFLQNCEYGFGTMLSVNFFTSLLRDGLWSDMWFGPEGPLRWGYFPPVMLWNDRQLQWSGILNQYLALRQAHQLSATLANTRVTPADVLLLLPSASLEVAGSQTHRELVGWGWVLTALKVQYDVLTEGELGRGVPARARLLILPQAVVLGALEAEAVRAYVAGGGLLLSTLVPGVVAGGGLSGTPPVYVDSPLADVLGCDLRKDGGAPVTVTQTGVEGTWLQTTVNRGLHSGRYTPVPPPDTGYPRPVEGRRVQNGQPYQVLVPGGAADVVARYGSGQPAIVEHRFGRGRALTLGYPYGNEILFADWTSIAFGKIYNGWARDPQMLEMVRWLRDTLERLGYVRRTTVPEGWRHRLQGFEAAVSSLSYPKGPPSVPGNEFGLMHTYLDPRPDHRIEADHDDLDYAAELTWRDRPGVATRYLAVANRESAYGGERSSVQFWMMPHIFRIRLDDPAVRQVYDIAAGAPVRLERDGHGVSFRVSVPPALGRVYAVSNRDSVELFESGPCRGASFEDVAAAVAALPAPADAPAEGVVLDPAGIRAWLLEQAGRELILSYGDEPYRAAAESAAAWLRERFGVGATATAADGGWLVEPPEGKCTVQFQPTPATVLIGNEWSNNMIAMLSSTWPFNNEKAPAMMSGRLSATHAWPPAGRGIVALTRAVEFRRENHTCWGISWNNHDGYAPRLVEAAPEPFQHRKLLILAATPQGAERAVQELMRTVNP